MLSKGSSPTCVGIAEAEPPSFVWVNVHHPTDTRQKKYRHFIRSSVTKEQHRKLRNDKGLKRSRSPTPTSPRPSSRRRRSSTGTTTPNGLSSPAAVLQPNWLVLLLPPYERTLSADDQGVFAGLARQEPALRTALQATMVARYCRSFMYRTSNLGSETAQPAMSVHERTLVHRRLAKLSGVSDLENFARLLEADGAVAADSGEGSLTAAMADMIGREAWNQVRTAEQAVLSRMSRPDLMPGYSDAAMGMVAAQLQCEVELAGQGEHVRTAGQCCSLLMHGLAARVPMAGTAGEAAVDEWWRQFERVMGAPLSALMEEPLMRHLVARSLEQARDLLGPAMFAT